MSYSRKVIFKHIPASLTPPSLKQLSKTESSISKPISISVPPYTAVKLLHAFASESPSSKPCIKPTKADSLSSMLTKKIYENTLTSWKDRGKSIQSSASMRGSAHRFGQISLDHSFIKEPDFHNILNFIIKSGFLDWQTFLSGLYSASNLAKKLWAALVTHSSCDFHHLSANFIDWENQSSLSDIRIDAFLAATLHFNFDIGSVIRFCGGKYTGAYRDYSETVRHLTRANPDSALIDEVTRLFQKGCPSYFNATSSHENFLTFLNNGNHLTIAMNIKKVLKTMNKEDKNAFVITLPRWIIRLVPNIHTTPQGYLIKPGKNDRLIWDGSHKYNWRDTNINSMQRSECSPAIKCGSSFNKHLVRI